jgi:hypothetical protein
MRKISAGFLCKWLANSWFNKIFAMVLILSLLAMLNSCGAVTSSNSGAPLTQDINSFVRALQNDNFTVQEGQVVFYNSLKWASQGLIPTCFGNNAGSPYLMPVIPPAPGQTPATGQNPPANYNPADPNNFPANPDFYPPGSIFKLRPDEAVVFVGDIAPPCVYFGFRSYVFFIENKTGKDYTGIPVIGNATVGFYHPIFGSLGDQLNNLNIYSEGTPNVLSGVPFGPKPPGVPFGTKTVIIATADQGINQRVRNALAQAGYSLSIINNDVIPSKLVNMGLEKGKDTFCYLMRISQWIDPAAGQDYINNLGSRTKVYRITPQTSSSLNPFPVPALKPRGSGKSEFEILNNVTGDMETLRTAILQKYATSAYTYKELDTSIGLLEGIAAYANDTNAQGDNRDTTYLKAGNFQFNSDSDFLIIYGLNHDKSGKSIYSNSVLYGLGLLNGICSVYSSLFLHSADAFFPQGYANAGNYYVYKMARSLSYPGENCVIVPYSTGNPNGTAYGIDNNQDVFPAFRAYVERATGIGASYYEIQYDRAIIFHKI